MTFASDISGFVSQARGPCRALILLFAFFLGDAGALQAQPVIPDTPAGRMLQMWVTAFDSDDMSVLRTFAELHMPPQMAARMESFRNQTGGVDLVCRLLLEKKHIIFLA